MSLNKGREDEDFFKKRYKSYTGEALDLGHPKTYNEKVMWLQLNDRNPLYHLMADKYLVKDYVKSIIGEKYVIPLIGVWGKACDIPFEELPQEYVLKCNHDSGSVYVKRADQEIDELAVVKQFERALKVDYYEVGRVWSYKSIGPLVFAEQLLQMPADGRPVDFKFFCFHGEPKFIQVNSYEDDGMKCDFFDIEWNHLPVHFKYIYQNATREILPPGKLELMLRLAKKLSSNIIHVRVDFYVDEQENVYFGEFTFCPNSAKEPFAPEIYNTIFGDYIDLDQT